MNDKSNEDRTSRNPETDKIGDSFWQLFIYDLKSVLLDAKRILLEVCYIFNIPIPQFKSNSDIDEDGIPPEELEALRAKRKQEKQEEKRRLINELKQQFAKRREAREKRLEWRKNRQESQVDQYLPHLTPEDLPPPTSLKTAGQETASTEIVKLPSELSDQPGAPEVASVSASSSSEILIQDNETACSQSIYILDSFYTLPSLNLLEYMADDIICDQEELDQKKEILQSTLDSFSIDAQVIGTTVGPRVTLFEIEPAIGVKVESIAQISNNIAMEMKATSIRILTPVPGYRFVGIEVPNRKQVNVSLRNLLASPTWDEKKQSIPLALGRDISGQEILLDLAEAPHLLIAGATGSGKSVCLNSLLVSLLYRFTPEEMRLILVDPKIVEFSIYKKLPHLIVPVITETKKVVSSLRWVIKEMEERYRILAIVGARNLKSYNSRPIPPEGQFDENGKILPEKLPFIVVIIDELADIMMTARSEVETYLARIAQLSRAVGIHTIIATQRPSVDVITGIIKANYPTRIAFQVSSQFDSRTILDGKGAESLLGRGDMLFKAPRSVLLQRIQSPIVLDSDLEKVLDSVCQQAKQQFELDIFNTSIKEEQEALQNQDFSDKDEALIQQALEIVLRDRKASTSYIQRCLRIGYNRAATIMEILEERGIVGPQVGANRREILVESIEQL